MNVQGFQLASVTKRYGTTVALSDVSLTFEPGKHSAILGPSGCGKSTLLRLLAGLDSPTTGTILIDGKIASEPDKIVMPPHQRGLTMAFQDSALWPNLNVMGNVLLGLAGLRLPRALARDRAQRAVGMCGLTELARRKPSQLSGGQQQRVALARAIAVEPRFLLLDEPFSGLDQRSRELLSEQIGVVSRSLNTTLIWVTHQRQDVHALCGRRVWIDGGKVMEIEG